MAESDVRGAVRILGHMVEEVDRDYWGIRRWEDHIARILSLGLGADLQTREHTVRLIDDLGRRHDVRYGELSEAE
ncbi:MAG: hypothetical protein A2V70_11445 [Planctomycetes bacterium RBG_13_63_9]|nr:MAG: hypothetical protein A2V70_11445 [Planctomycetes bacterium RBG_13_63_9]